jgi:hypothetical protein
VSCFAVKNEKAYQFRYYNSKIECRFLAPFYIAHRKEKEKERRVFFQKWKEHASPRRTVRFLIKKFKIKIKKIRTRVHRNTVRADVPFQKIILN